MSLKYSICVPVYNNEKYLRQAIESVINQTYKNFELILVDDYSTDKSFDICKEYSKTDKRIKVYKSETDKGPLFCINKAIQEADSDYITFLDSDDYYEADALEVINNFIVVDNPDLLITSFRYVDENGSELNKYINKYRKYSAKDRSELIYMLATHNLYNSLWQKTIKSAICKNIKIRDDCMNIIRGNDKFFSALIYKDVNDVILISNILYNYRRNMEGITKAASTNYSIEYRDKKEMSDLIKNDSYISPENKEKYKEFEFRRFKSQLIRISNVKTTKLRKKQLFKEIKDSDYYKNNLSELKFNSLETKLFKNSRYSLLISYCEIKSGIIRIIKNGQLIKKIKHVF